MDAQTLTAFRSIPYGVYLLTVRQGADLHTVIVSWVSQVSFFPPRLMVALRHNRRAIPAIRKSQAFSLSLLSTDQKDLVARLKDSNPSFPSAGPWEPGDSSSAPILRDCLAGWRCRLFSTVEAGDHILFLGEVESAFSGRGTVPLTTMDLGKTYIGQF